MQIFTEPNVHSCFSCGYVAKAMISRSVLTVA